MSYSSEVLADTPVGYWRLGEQSGTTASDSSGNSRNGTYTGGFTLQGAGLIEDTDDSTSFNGTTGYVNLGTNVFSPVLNGATQVTIEAWILINSLSTNQTILFIPIATGGVVGVQMQLLTTGTISMLGRSVSTDANQTGADATIGSVGRVLHMVGVFDYPNDRIRVYRNGRLVTTQTVAFANNSYTAGTPNTIDAIAYTGSGEFFNGLIDEVAIYSTELSATRIRTHWDAGSTQHVFKGLSQSIQTSVFVGTTTSMNKTLSHRRLLPVWAGDTIGGADSGSSSGVPLYQVPVNGSISGIVKLNGVPVADTIVRLYYRKHGTMVGSVKTDSTGTFTFINLNPNDKYTVVAYDNLNVSPDYNAKIFDILTPV